MLSRRAFCFESNAHRIAGMGRLYLWTFTRKAAEDYTSIRESWNKLLTYLRRAFPQWSGIRVYEVHPGKWNEFSHGLHVHVICNNRFEVDEIRKVTNTAEGWGRIHVARVKPSTWRYVTKYLWKPRSEALKGWRLWSCFNLPERSRLADIFIDSIRSRLFRIGARSETFTCAKWPERLTQVAKWVWEIVAGARRITGLGVHAAVTESGELRSMLEEAEKVGGSKYQLLLA